MLTAEDLIALDLRADLVTLSACDTGLGERLSGDELLGLVRAVLVGGSASMLVTLWAVDDYSTELLLRRFYQRLMDGGRRPGRFVKAEALRAAQRAVKTMTAADVLADCDSQMGRLPPRADAPRRRRLEFARVRALVGARALTEAGRALERLDGALADGSDPALHARVRRAAALVRLKAEVAGDVDYGRTPFADPRHWASFVLVGDWG